MQYLEHGQQQVKCEYWYESFDNYYSSINHMSLDGDKKYFIFVLKLHNILLPMLINLTISALNYNWLPLIYVTIDMIIVCPLRYINL